MIKAHLGKVAPYTTDTGVELLNACEGTAIAHLEQRNPPENHIRGQHNEAMFAVGEAVSGALVADALAPVISQVRPVATGAEITYLKFAQGALTATAATSLPSKDLLCALEVEGKVAFGVLIDIRDDQNETAVEMIVNWHVSMWQN